MPPDRSPHRPPPPRRPSATAAGSFPCSSGVGGRSSTSPDTMSVMRLAHWFRSRGRFFFVEGSSDAGAPPSLSQPSRALVLLFGRLGCWLIVVWVARCGRGFSARAPCSEARQNVCPRYRFRDALAQPWHQPQADRFSAGLCPLRQYALAPVLFPAASVPYSNRPTTQLIDWRAG